MKLMTGLILLCAALVLTGCSTYQGGTTDEYNTDTGANTSSPNGVPLTAPGASPQSSIPQNTPP